MNVIRECSRRALILVSFKNQCKNTAEGEVKMLRLGTVFSGIGAVEHALEKLNIQFVRLFFIVE